MKRKLLIISNIVLVMLSIALIILNSSLIVEYFSSIDKENGQNLSAGFAVVFLIIFSIPALIIGLGSVPLNIIFSKKVNKIWGIVFLYKASHVDFMFPFTSNEIKWRRFAIYLHFSHFHPFFIYSSLIIVLFPVLPFYHEKNQKSNIKFS